MKSPNRRSSIDDELFEIALAIPALFAAARYLDPERERIALARLQGARATAVARSGMPVLLSRSDRRFRYG